VGRKAEREIIPTSGGDCYTSACPSLQGEKEK